MTKAFACFRSHLDRQHGVLIAAGDAAPLRRDLELHLLSIGVDQDADVKRMLGDGLAAMALYMISRPRFEYFGWTIRLAVPRLHIFVAGSVSDRSVVGRAYRETGEPSSGGVFIAQTARPFGDIQTSSVDIEGNDLLDLVEQYCAKSDQQPVRVFRGRGDEVALVAMFPDADRPWFEAIAGDEVFRALREGGLHLVSENEISFRCGCDTERITKLVAELYREDPEDLFRGDPDVEVECPRCGTKHSVARSSFDAALKP